MAMPMKGERIGDHWGYKDFKGREREEKGLLSLKNHLKGHVLLT